MALPITNPLDPAALRRLRLQEALTRHGWPYLPYAATGEPDTDQLVAMLAGVGIRLDDLHQDANGAWEARFSGDGHGWTGAAFSRGNALVDAACAALADLPRRATTRTNRRLGDRDAAAQRRG
jgi:hypothetical protein